jgi:hypothetical protein
MNLFLGFDQSEGKEIVLINLTRTGRSPAGAPRLSSIIVKVKVPKTDFYQIKLNLENLDTLSLLKGTSVMGPSCRTQ